MYFEDKRAARRGNWRTPEKHLHYLELTGGWLGGFLGQRYTAVKRRCLRCPKGYTFG